ncbi:MAG: rhomboid family intramembrane serine protease [Myxococcota bacterium]
MFEQHFFWLVVLSVSLQILIWLRHLRHLGIRPWLIRSVMLLLLMGVSRWTLSATASSGIAVAGWLLLLLVPLMFMRWMNVYGARSPWHTVRLTTWLRPLYWGTSGWFLPMFWRGYAHFCAGDMHEALEAWASHPELKDQHEQLAEILEHRQAMRWEALAQMFLDALEAKVPLSFLLRSYGLRALGETGQRSSMLKLLKDPPSSLQPFTPNEELIALAFFGQTARLQRLFPVLFWLPPEQKQYWLAIALASEGQKEQAQALLEQICHRTSTSTTLEHEQWRWRLQHLAQIRPRTHDPNLRNNESIYPDPSLHNNESIYPAPSMPLDPSLHNNESIQHAQSMPPNQVPTQAPASSDQVSLWAQFEHHLFERDALQMWRFFVPLSEIRVLVGFAMVLMGVYLVQVCAGPFWGRDGVLLWGAFSTERIALGEYWRLFTSNLLHANLLHISMNLFSLFVFGAFVEIWWTRGSVIGLLVCSGVCANLLIGVSVGLGWQDGNFFLVGASSCVMGIFGAAAAIHVKLLGSRFTSKARSNIALLVGLMLVQSTLDALSPHVSGSAHAFGALSGFLFTMVLFKLDRVSYIDL